MIFGALSHPSLNPKIFLVVIVLFVLFLLAARFGLIGGSSRGGGSDEFGHTGIQGQGRKWQCQRCGTWFQPEKEETMSGGQTRRWVDDRCPHCGWDKDFQDRNHDGRPDQYE